MAISFSNFTTLANTVLDDYLKIDPVAQNIQNKPTLAWLERKSKAFPGGQGYVSGPAQGQFMSDQAGFGLWYSHTDQVTFVHPDNILRSQYQWREWHTGAVLDFTELRQRGVSVTEDGQPGRKNEGEFNILKDWLADVMVMDFSESLMRFLNSQYWADGTQASGAVVGLLGLFGEDPTTGTVGNLNRATYNWWRHQVDLAIPYSPANQTLTQTLRRRMIQQRRYGGMPDYGAVGSDALDALQKEYQAKGLYTQKGFAGSNDASIGDISLDGVQLSYEPYLDDLGLSKEIFIFDSRHLKLMPMTGSYKVPMKATRPYDQMVLLKSVTGACTLSVDQFNCHGRYRMQ